MALGQRELLLMIRARDLASGTFRQIGSGMRMMGTDASRAAGQMMGASAALTTVGTSMGLMGAAGLAFFNNATNAAIDYRQQVALTLTQAEGGIATFQQISEAGLRVAQNIPVPFEEIQNSLYDIFSSMTVTMQEAEFLLQGFAREAVAGQSDIQSAGRSTIAIMNALGIGVEELDRIQDVQFQTVRKGVITYEELSQNIGKILPAAARTGQSIETLGGMMAFLTRNGLSAEMAATSAARAMELFGHPKTVARIEAMGIAVRDSRGEYRQINDVVTDLGRAMAGLTAPERAKALDELFKGAGNRIQARRFFDTAIQGFDGLNARVSDMHNSAGAMDEAYDIMFNQPQSQIDLLNNKFQAMKIAIGEGLIPVKMRMVEVASKLLEWWNGLSDGTQKLIVKITLIGSVLLVVVGGVLTLTGAIAGLIAVFMLAGASFATAIGIIAGITVVIPIIIGLVYLLITHWDTLKQWTLAAWEAIKEAIGVAVEFISELFSGLVEFLSEAWSSLSEGAVEAWQGFVEFITEITTLIVETITSFVESTVGKLQELWNWFSQTEFAAEAWNLLITAFESGKIIVQEVVATLIHILTSLGGSASMIFNQIVVVLQFVLSTWQTVFNLLLASLQAWWGIIQPLLTGIFEIFKTIFQFGLDYVLTAWTIAWETMRLALTVVIGVLQALIGGFWTAVQGIFDVALNAIIAAVTIAWDFIRNVIEGALKIISGIIQVVMSVIRGDWGSAWDGIKRIVDGVWQIIKTVVETGINSVKVVIETVLGIIRSVWDGAWDAIKLFLTESWQGIYRAASQWIDQLLDKMRELPGKALEALGNIATALYEAGKDLIRGLINGVKSMVGALKNTVTDTLGGALDAGKSLLGLGSPSKVFHQFGEWSGEGLALGMMSMAGRIEKASKFMASAALNGSEPLQFGSSFGSPVGSGSGARRDISVTFASGAIQISGVQDPEAAAEMAADNFEEIIREVVTG